MGSRKVAQLFLRALVITNIVGFSSVCGVPPGFAQDTILRVDTVSASPGDTAIPVDITTSNSILVASTDLILSYETTALTATNVIVPHLSLSAANLDDAQGEVKLLTTDPMGVTLLANDILVTVIFDVEPNPQPGCYPLTLTDSDGGSDFEQPLPPIPPPRVSWTSEDGEFCVEEDPGSTTTTVVSSSSSTSSTSTSSPSSTSAATSSATTTITTTSTTVPTTTSTIRRTTTVPTPPDVDCFASAIYGEDSEEIEILRNYRDGVLAKTPKGRAFINLFYQLSPVIAKKMEEDPEFRGKVRRFCDLVVGTIEASEE